MSRRKAWRHSSRRSMPWANKGASTRWRCSAIRIWKRCGICTPRARPAAWSMGPPRSWSDRRNSAAARACVRAPGCGVDGAPGFLVGSADFGRRSGLRPRARVRAYAAVGSEPTLMLDGPAAATEKALRRAGMAIGDIDLFEVNEAFAAVVLRYMRATGAPHERVNVNGGSIALGHPLGATGAMLVGTVLDELERRDLCTGLVTLCAAAGQATATIIERV